jgi:hypothetical protein
MSQHWLASGTAPFADTHLCLLLPSSLMLLLPVLLPLLLLLLLLPLLQVYAASIMFGYFLRRVDKRFQLESALGMIDTPADTEEAVARLERLFAQVRGGCEAVARGRHSFAPSYFVAHKGCNQVGGWLTCWLVLGTVCVYRPDWMGAKQRHGELTSLVQLMPAAGLGAEPDSYAV